jgi:hypothetical protein
MADHDTILKVELVETAQTDDAGRAIHPPGAVPSHTEIPDDEGEVIVGKTIVLQPGESFTFGDVAPAEPPVLVVQHHSSSVLHLPHGVDADHIAQLLNSDAAIIDTDQDGSVRIVGKSMTVTDGPELTVGETALPVYALVENYQPGHSHAWEVNRPCCGGHRRLSPEEQAIDMAESLANQAGGFTSEARFALADAMFDAAARILDLVGWTNEAGFQLLTQRGIWYEAQDRKVEGCASIYRAAEIAQELFMENGVEKEDIRVALAWANFGEAKIAEGKFEEAEWPLASAFAFLSTYDPSACESDFAATLKANVEDMLMQVHRGRQSRRSDAGQPGAAPLAGTEEAGETA